MEMNLKRTRKAAKAMSSIMFCKGFKCKTIFYNLTCLKYVVILLLHFILKYTLMS